MGLGDWLGTGTIGPRDYKFCAFHKARAFVRGLGLKSETEWRAFCKSGKRPSDIPAAPNLNYREAGWKVSG